VAAFIAENFARYRTRPVTRDELAPMMLVARWLKERTPDDGRLIYLKCSEIAPSEILRIARGASPIGELPRHKGLSRELQRGVTA
ncbi:MAG: hypothetical protein ACRD37_13675, partial [Candidatus Acidiferrales bacterium]